MQPTMTHMQNDMRRRSVLAGLVALPLAAILPRGAAALTTDEARQLIDNLVRDINNVINSGRAESQMFAEFQRIFTVYGDTEVIARKVLGVDWRRASAAQQRGFVRAFEGYMARKYGRRFREFIGGSIEVTGSRQVKSVWEVVSIARLAGQAPFEVRWLVANKAGKAVMFNMFIEGINMTSSEATEIGAMLDRRKGNIDQLIADLRTAG